MKLPKDLFTSLLTTAILIGQTLLAQSEEATQLAEPFEGVWQASFPESGQKAYLILKGNQVASYFFDLTADNLVHSATWTLDSVITPKAIISGSLGDNFEIFRGAVSYQVNWLAKMEPR